MKGLSVRESSVHLEPAISPLVVVLVVEILGLLLLTHWGCMAVIFLLARSDIAPLPVDLLVMMGVLALAYVTWSVLRLLGAVCASTGGGITVAAYGLLARVLTEAGTSPFDPNWEEQVLGASHVALLEAGHFWGFVAFVFGLAMVLAASLADWGLARRKARKVT